MMGGQKLVQDPQNGVVGEGPCTDFSDKHRYLQRFLLTDHPTRTANDFTSLDLGSTGSSFKIGSDASTSPPAWKAINYKVDKAAGLPHVSNGAMWADGEDVYIYEGRLPGLPKEAASSLWKFTSSSSTWAQHITWTHADTLLPNRVSRGGSVSVPGRGYGVYLGGARIFINDTGTPQNGNWQYYSNEQLTTFDLKSSNRTTTGLPDSQKRFGTALAYLPIGSEGAIIAIGGTLENDQVRVRMPCIYAKLDIEPEVY